MTPNQMIEACTLIALAFLLGMAVSTWMYTIAVKSIKESILSQLESLEKEVKIQTTEYLGEIAGLRAQVESLSKSQQMLKLEVAKSR